MIKPVINVGNVHQAAIFMSGGGSNAEKILESVKSFAGQSWWPVVVVTDAPDQSNAEKIAGDYNLPLIKHDIRKFYRERGEIRTSLINDRGRQIREEWTCELRRLLKPYTIDFGIFAGFMPLTNIIADFPCLNVHPGDLTVEKNGRRILVGLHTVPIERAILGDLKFMRSSVIIAQVYTGSGPEMDSGPILGISPPVEIDLQGHSREELKESYAVRSGKRPKGGYNDVLDKIAQFNQNKLKEQGDWTVFPRVVADFASGRFGLDENQDLYYRENNDWLKIKTVMYTTNNKELIFA